MSQKTSESDDGMFCNDQSESSSLDKNGGSRNRGIVLKKGPWTSAEDAILIAYVKKHGEGNWNAVQKHSGLYRCGKSCRLRWANHLRPDLKKGAFTQEEEQLIVELHAKMGNKWARMAAHLPGRTDNEIKNYWNTRIKRRQRAGLPLYPPEVSFQALHEGQSQNINGINDGDKTHHGLVQDHSYEIPDVVFDSLKGNQAVLPYELGDITANGMLIKGFDYSQYCSFTPPMLHRQKRLRESSVLLPGGYDTGRVKNEFPSLDQFHNEIQSFGGFFPLDPNASVKHSESFELNDNLSASKPMIGAVKLELPSLQYPETDLASWGTSSSPQPLLETVDAYIQSPPASGTVDSDCPASPCNSGLLDALIHESKTRSNMKNLQSSDKSSYSSSVIPGEVAYSSLVNVGATEWEDYGDPLSPLGHCATSFFSKCTPLSASGSSLDEQAPIDTLIGSKVKSESGDQGWTPDRGKESTTLYEVRQADAFIAADWLDQDTAYANDPSDMSDAIATLLGDDLGSEYKRVLVGTSTSSNSNHQGLAFGSCAWNNMPPVCQISELP